MHYDRPYRAFVVHKIIKAQHNKPHQRYHHNNTSTMRVYDTQNTYK